MTREMQMIEALEKSLVERFQRLEAKVLKLENKGKLAAPHGAAATVSEKLKARPKGKKS